MRISDWSSDVCSSDLGHLVAVLGDDVADVVTLERYRERVEGAHHRVHRRERVGVAVDLVGLVVAGHCPDAQLRVLDNWALGAQLLVLRVWVLPTGLVEVVVLVRPVGTDGRTSLGSPNTWETLRLGQL